MKLKIYGFEANVKRSEGWYIGEIKDLHVVEQAKTLKTLKKRLKEGVRDVLSVIKEISF
jgi:protein required for attachment to host cells